MVAVLKTSECCRELHWCDRRFFMCVSHVTSQILSRIRDDRISHTASVAKNNSYIVPGNITISRTVFVRLKYQELSCVACVGGLLRGPTANCVPRFFENIVLHCTS